MWRGVGRVGSNGCVTHQKAHVGVLFLYFLVSAFIFQVFSSKNIEDKDCGSIFASCEH